MVGIYPLVLCGGVGTRLWPLSRSNNPKQFQAINGSEDTTFFQATVSRHVADGFEEPIISVNRSHLGVVKQQLNDIDTNATIIAEPLGRNTGPAVLAAAIHLSLRDPDAIMAVLPSDHIIKGDLNKALKRMVPAAHAGKIALFGIEPRYPETGYGYIVDGGPHDEVAFAQKVSRFVEKPPFEIAEQMMIDRNAFWASGISMFRADVIMEEYRRLDPDSFEQVMAAYSNAEYFPDRLELAGEDFARAVSGPTEAIVFEKTDRTILAPTDIDWNDVGAWKAFHAVSEKDDQGNYVSGDVVCIDSKDSYIRGSQNRLIAVLGIEDLVIVDTDDALLVTTHDHSQKVKSIISTLEEDGRNEVVAHASKTLPWGQAIKMQSGKSFNLTMLRIEPGRTLLFDEMAHYHRLLTFSEGQGVFTNKAGISQFTPGDVVEVKEGEAATFRNTGNETAVIVEIQYKVEGEEVLDYQKSAVLGVEVRAEEVA
ncbi:sugar phosphate nucleotidyltransferase [uncultured Cohaesibacter sp.]|uniref:mannose-1-phosphate guanylyltransferase n=1 Tax=uncultured Cohaesibacter sp. TaxID=1002546 RepID=UPI002AAAD7B4|nr:sugar phosphate nucleotidyltransferase [uncultured Cohaesibacter sp.]